MGNSLPKISLIELPRCVISISGEDCREFLQGLISNDIRKLDNQPIRHPSGGWDPENKNLDSSIRWNDSLVAIYAAMLSPQGRLIYDFLISKKDDAYLLDVDISLGDELIKTLKLYKLRSKVIIQKLDNMRVFASDSSRENSYPDPRDTRLGYRILAENLQSDMDYSAYEKRRIMLRIPDSVKDMIAERALLLDYDFERLNGVDFQKGCYVGQEVTARMKYKATSRKSLYLLEAKENFPSENMDIFSGKKLVGRKLSSYDNIALALLKDEEAQHNEFICGDLLCQMINHNQPD